MWELDGEERASQLGMRGDLTERETAELAELRSTAGNDTDGNDKIR